MLNVQAQISVIANIELIERMLTMNSERLDLIAIKQVAEDGHRLTLTGDDRIEAIRIMSQRGIPVEQMAHRLYTDRGNVEKIAKRAGIKFKKPKAHWTFQYMDQTRAERRKRERESERAKRKAQD